MKLYIQNVKDKRIKNPKKAEYDIPECLTDETCDIIEDAINDHYYYNFFVDHPGRSVLIEDWKSAIMEEISKYKFKKEFNGENTWNVLHEMKKEIEKLRDELASIKSTFRNAFGRSDSDYYD